jgi:hypothetical protein
LKENVFFNKKEYECLIRFSNSTSQDDSDLGSRGMAVKVLDVEG